MHSLAFSILPYESADVDKKALDKSPIMFEYSFLTNLIAAMQSRGKTHFVAMIYEGESVQLSLKALCDLREINLFYHYKRLLIGAEQWANGFSGKGEMDHGIDKSNPFQLRVTRL